MVSSLVIFHITIFSFSITFVMVFGRCSGLALDSWKPPPPASLLSPYRIAMFDLLACHYCTKIYWRIIEGDNLSGKKVEWILYVWFYSSVICQRFFPTISIKSVLMHDKKPFSYISIFYKSIHHIITYMSESVDSIFFLTEEKWIIPRFVQARYKLGFTFEIPA